MGDRIMTNPPIGRAVLPDGWVIYDNPPVRGRSCGSCKLCCTLTPVDAVELQKPANVKCKHLGAKGCRIYDHRPEPCAFWSCRWLIDPDTASMRRPDLVGYLVDPQRATVRIRGQLVEAIQVYVDPDRPDAHRDPELRAYLDRLGKQFTIPTIVRWSNEDNGMLLVPPSLRADGEWHEQTSELVPREVFEGGN